MNSPTNPTIALRPSSLEGFVGQEKLKNVLSIGIMGARSPRGRILSEEGYKAIGMTQKVAQFGNDVEKIFN